MLLLDYQPEYRADCLAICRSNIPRYIDPSEEALFSEFLDRLPRPGLFYYIVRADIRIVACGGFMLEPDKERAYLCWGLVQVDWHGKGIGRFMLEHRLERSRSEPGIRRIAMDTSQHTYRFFEKFGFSVGEIIENGYGPGLHRYEMRLELI